MLKSSNQTRNKIEEKVVRIFAKRKWILALAESCTGGFIASKVTNVPGASKMFAGGIVVYSNRAKEKILGVRGATLNKFGAVSENVAREMAIGVQKKFDADFVIAVTGIAGPTGGTKRKPVGTVFIAVAGPTGIVVQRKLNLVSREKFQEITAGQALELLLDVAKD